jgi:uncharacterized protein
MSKHVPDFINPFRAAEGGYGVAGRLAFARMGRLVEVVENPDGAAEVSLDFDVDEQGIPRSDEEAKRLPDQYDPLVAGGQSLSVAQLIEDEVLLALPAIPRHDDAVCTAVNAVMMEERHGEGDSAESSASPFSVLARLKPNP